MKKRLLSTLLVLCMVLSLMPVTASAVEIVASGKCGARGSNLSWTLNYDGLLTIEGRGEMDEFRGDSQPWENYHEQIYAVIINRGVTSIGGNAFRACSSLISVDIPDSVISIGNAAFDNCRSLTSLYIPDSVTSIGGRAFYGCSSLTSVDIPDGVTNIDTSFTFYGCSNLTSVTIPDSVTSIGGGAFYNCRSLTSLYIPDSVTSIGSQAFAWCTNLTNVTIPSSVTSIGGSAFNNCGSLANVTIPDGITSIGTATFLNCYSLTRVTIPDSVTNIGGQAFYGCRSLTDVYYSGSETDWNAIDIGVDNYDLTGAHIHYNSTGPDHPVTPGGVITLRPDSDTISVGDEILISAGIPNPSGLQNSDIIWSSSNESVATITAESFSDFTSTAIARIRGISPGTAAISITLSDGRSAFLDIHVVANSADGNSIVTADTFNQDIYRADLQINRRDASLRDVLNSLLRSKSPSPIIAQELYEDLDLLDATNAWLAVTNTFNSAEKPANLYNLAIKEKDFYTAYLLDVLQASAGHVQEDIAERAMNAAQGWLGEATRIIKLEYDIDHLNDLSDREKEIIAKAYMDLLGENVEFEAWDTDHAFLGYMDTVFGYYGMAMNAAGDIKDFTNRVASTYALSVMSESTKNVIRELYNNCPPSNASLRSALRDIESAINTSEFDLQERVASDTLKIAGTKAATKLVNEYWDKAVLSCTPEVKILLSAYKASKWVSDKLFGASAIAEACQNIMMATSFESLMTSTVDSLAEKFNRSPNLTNAAAYLKSVDIYFSELNKSSKQASSFVDAIDSALVSKVARIFNSTGSQTRDAIKENISIMQSSYSETKDYGLWNGWIYALDDDFPESGLYEKYSSQLISPEGYYKSVRKTVTVTPPVDAAKTHRASGMARDVEEVNTGLVDVLIYDARNNLVAYFKDGKVHCDENAELTLIIQDDALEIAFYDDADYRVEYVGIATNTMDVTVTEYSSSGETIRNVYFQDLPLQVGTIYRTEIDDQILGAVDYTLSRDDGKKLDADLDTYHPNVEKYTLIIVSGTTEANGEDVFQGEFYAGQTVNLRAYTPNGCRFTGWAANVADVSFGDATQEVTTFKMPSCDVIVRATIAETGYSVMFDANGGICDTVVIATGLDGKLDALPVPSYPGYIFQGWFTAASGGEKVDTGRVYTEDTIVYAHWTKDETPPDPTSRYTIILNASPAECGSVTGGGTYDEGELVSVTATPASGYRFVRWTEGGTTVSTSATYPFTITKNRTLTAVFEPISSSGPSSTLDYSSSSDSDPTYSIKVPSRVTGGTVKVTPTSASEGQRVTITVKANSGYELDALTVADSKGNNLTLTNQGNGKYTFTMPKGNVSVDAQFQRIESSVTPVQTVSVNPTNDKLEVNGKPQTPAAYKINDYNYFKLRDIAALLNGTGKQFSVGYESSTGEVSLTSGQPYEVTSSDLTALPVESRQATISTNIIYINGVRTQLTIYKIDGYNYFKLRDLASALDFSVGWTAERGMFLESDKPYSE